MFNEIVMKLKLGMQMRLFADYFFIKAKLIMIDLQKQLLTLELE